MSPDPTKPDAVALLPCPFCGAQPDARDIGPEWVECPSCGCSGPADPYRSREDAWNRRAALARRPESAGEGAEVDEAARIEFEQQANDSYGFKRSRRGTYQNPAVARDWKWFRAGMAFTAKRDGASQAEQQGDRPEIKGAWIDGGYVIVTPAGRGSDKAKAVKAAILALLPIAARAAGAQGEG